MSYITAYSNQYLNTTGTFIPNNITSTGTYSTGSYTISTPGPLTETSLKKKDGKNITIKDGNDFKEIIEYVPNKVYEFIFNDDTHIKTVCAPEDIFNLEYAFYLALAKKIWHTKLNIQGITTKAYELYGYKYESSIVKRGMKLFKKQQEEKEKQEKEEKLRKERYKKHKEKKKKRSERKEKESQNTLKNIIIQAIKEAQKF